MPSTAETAAEAMKSCTDWYHSIELAPGVTTPGLRSAETCRKQLLEMQLPDLNGKSVLDIGAWDGYFSFAAERLGAARVVALDHFVWSIDWPAYKKDWVESQQKGTSLPHPEESSHWRPSELPGRKPFDVARAVLGSRVQPVVGDFMTMDLSPVGNFDVVFFLGVLYHMEDPLRAMHRVASLTKPGGLAIIETEAMEIPGLQGAFCEFFPGRELNNDPTNWWAPNARAVESLCRAAGFREIKVLTKVPRAHVSVSQCLQSLIGGGANSFRSITSDSAVPRDGCVQRYRLIAHAMN